MVRREGVALGRRGRISDDLATDSDVALVDEGAVFYWTVGKGRNSAGTQSNVSLVRFRRLPPSSRLHQARAEQEATELLEELGDAS